ncbi:a-factor receptor [Orbilia brochopaga]|uniref:A-factor receptor n=1 Tax=Orbilia brochopaga TaxID=3140254 RepID=A0AAV9V396_9PEZI
MSSERIFFCIASAIAILFLTIPLLWQIRRSNVAAALLVFWLQSDLILNLSDAIIFSSWRTVLFGWSGAGYCDFVAKWKMAAEFGGINSAVMCIMITIYRMFWSMSMYRESKESKRFRMIYEWGIAGLFPVMLAGLHYVVQPSRYYLTPVYGCHEPIDNSWVSLIVLGWPLVFSSVSIVLVVLIMYKLQSHMQERSIIGLFRSSSRLDESFKRLYLLTALFTLIYYPTNIYGLVVFCISPMLPYSWTAVHDPSWWNKIYKFPDSPAYQYQRWIKVVAAWILFVIFGRGGEATKIYWDLAKLLRLHRELAMGIRRYRKFKWMCKFVYIPRIIPEWMRKKEPPSPQLVNNPNAAPEGNTSAQIEEKVKRQGWLYRFFRLCRRKIMGERAVQLDLESTGEDTHTTLTTTATLDDGLQPSLLNRIRRILRTRIGRPQIHFEFNIRWIRESLYTTAPVLNFSKYRLSVPGASHFCDTFDATMLEKIAQQASLQLGACNIHARRHQLVGQNQHTATNSLSSTLPIYNRSSLQPTVTKRSSGGDLVCTCAHNARNSVNTYTHTHNTSAKDSMEDERPGDVPQAPAVAIVPGRTIREILDDIRNGRELRRDDGESGISVPQPVQKK